MIRECSSVERGFSFYQHVPVRVQREPALLSMLLAVVVEKLSLSPRPRFSGVLQSVSVVEHAFKLLVISQ